MFSYSVRARLPVIRPCDVAGDGHVDSATWAVQMTLHQCQVFAVDLAVMLCHHVLDARGFSEDDDARCVSVEPIERMDARRLSPALEIARHGMDERIARRAMRRMDDHARGLVDDEKGLILIENVERQIDGHDGRYFLPEQRQLIARMDAQADIAMLLPIDKDRAVPLDVLPELRREPERRAHELAQFPAVVGSIYGIGNLQWDSSFLPKVKGDVSRETSPLSKMH